ncbi:MAG: hypothetical protein ACJ0GJ_05150 [Candidatus Actinomarina sp.]
MNLEESSISIEYHDVGINSIELATLPFPGVATDLATYFWLGVAYGRRYIDSY